MVEDKLGEGGEAGEVGAPGGRVGAQVAQPTAVFERQALQAAQLAQACAVAHQHHSVAIKLLRLLLQGSPTRHWQPSCCLPTSLQPGTAISWDNPRHGVMALRCRQVAAQKER